MCAGSVCSRVLIWFKQILGGGGTTKMEKLIQVEACSSVLWRQQLKLAVLCRLLQLFAATWATEADRSLERGVVLVHQSSFPAVNSFRTPCASTDKGSEFSKNLDFCFAILWVEWMPWGLRLWDTDCLWWKKAIIHQWASSNDVLARDTVKLPSLFLLFHTHKRLRDGHRQRLRCWPVAHMVAPLRSTFPQRNVVWLHSSAWPLQPLMFLWLELWSVLPDTSLLFSLSPQRLTDCYVQCLCKRRWDCWNMLGSKTGFASASRDVCWETVEKHMQFGKRHYIRCKKGDYL